jgi:hypothetical protein
MSTLEALSFITKMLASSQWLFQSKIFINTGLGRRYMGILLIYRNFNRAPAPKQQPAREV